MASGYMLTNTASSDADLWRDAVTCPRPHSQSVQNPLFGLVAPFFFFSLAHVVLQFRASQLQLTSSSLEYPHPSPKVSGRDSVIRVRSYFLVRNPSFTKICDSCQAVLRECAGTSRAVWR